MNTWLDSSVETDRDEIITLRSTASAIRRAYVVHRSILTDKEFDLLASAAELLEQIPYLDR